MIEPFFATIAVSFATLACMEAKAGMTVAKSIQRPKSPNQTIGDSRDWGI
jgi:hypothetical protein